MAARAVGMGSGAIVFNQGRRRVNKFLRKKLRGIRKRTVQWLAPSPVKDYGERTMMYVPQRDASEPNRFLIDVAIKSISRAQDISLSDLSARQGTNAPDYPEAWPGEHSRLLAAIVAVLQPLAV